MENLQQQYLNLIKKYLINSCIESFGLLHQIFFLEFRHNDLGDISFHLETNVKILPEIEIKNILSKEQYILLCFNAVNLKKVIDIKLDNFNNLSICFEDDYVLIFEGQNDEVHEIWTFKNSENNPKSDKYLSIIAFSGGGYCSFGSG